ncbi:MAG: hypothetical protein K8Q89_08310 [Nitrosarchaeum sp.]|nr:hypothetical protein [Nitrosarchaeum sp.]
MVIVTMIICKGARKFNKLEKCDFQFSGNWGEQELVEHQNLHKSLENENYSWLGFDISQSFGIYSERDGKRF